MQIRDGDVCLNGSYFKYLHFKVSSAVQNIIFHSNNIINNFSGLHFKSSKKEPWYSRVNWLSTEHRHHNYNITGLPYILSFVYTTLDTSHPRMWHQSNTCALKLPHCAASVRYWPSVTHGWRRGSSVLRSCLVPHVRALLTHLMDANRYIELANSFCCPLNLPCID